MLKRFNLKTALSGALIGGLVAGAATFMGESMLWWLVVPIAAISCAFPDTAKAGDQSGSPTWSSSSSTDSWGDSSGSGDGGGGGGGDGG